MTVTDEAKLFAIRTQLLEMRFKLDASIKIINYVFERHETPPKLDNGSVLGYDTCSCDPVTGLYPGQKPNMEDTECENEADMTECLE